MCYPGLTLAFPGLPYVPQAACSTSAGGGGALGGGGDGLVPELVRKRFSAGDAAAAEIAFLRGGVHAPVCP